MRRMRNVFFMVLALGIIWIAAGPAYAADVVQPVRPGGMKAAPSAQKTVPQGMVSPGATKAPAVTKPNTRIPDKIPQIIQAEITSLTLATDPGGTWQWKAVVRNTGPKAISGRDILVQGYRQAFASTKWDAASGSIVSTGSILPGQSVTVTRAWTRCCRTNKLKVDLLLAGSHSLLDSELLDHLLLNPTLNHPVDVRVARLEWNDTAKTWVATIKNLSDYTVKLIVQGYLWPAGTNTPVPAGGQQLMLAPHAEGRTMGLHANTARHGDTLKVHLKFLMGGAACNESDNDCGFKGSNNTTIPESRTYSVPQY